MDSVKECLQRTAEMCSREEEQRAENNCQHNMRSKFVLNCQKDFDKVYRFGKSQGSKYVVLFYRKNDLGYTRISYLASKKVGNSVKRNRARRLMREAFRLSGQTISEGYDLIFIARSSITETDMRGTMRSEVAALKKARGVLI